MNIIITASLTEEQIEILSNMKGYQPTITTGTIEEPVVVQNPISRSEFIMNQYKGLIDSDASNEYIKYAKRQREEAEQAEENAIREQVKASISSSIE